MEALPCYDMQFQQRWYTQAFTILDPLWAAAPPSDHFVRDVALPTALPSIISNQAAVPS
jgi:hypothetical protein